MMINDYWCVVRTGCGDLVGMIARLKTDNSGDFVLSSLQAGLAVVRYSDL